MREGVFFECNTLPGSVLGKVLAPDLFRFLCSPLQARGLNTAVPAQAGTQLLRARPITPAATYSAAWP
jgi:hypothetical protein